MGKLTFNIVEIPEGESTRVLSLTDDDLDLSPYDFAGGDIEVSLFRAQKFIRVHYNVHAGVELTCDRSLEEFVHPVDTSYDVIFKTEVEEVTEDENGAVRRFNFSNNTLSIEEEVRDSVMLEIPMQKIHPKFKTDDGDYKAYDTKSFGEEPKNDETELADPRWEKLKELKN